MKIALLSISFLISCFISYSQDLKPLDYTRQYEKHHIRTRICKQVHYKGQQVVDSTMVGIASFDEKGRMIHYTEFFAGGRKMAEYDYSYNESGKMIKSSVSLVFNGWIPMEFELKYDKKDRVISRELKEAMANFWKKETYTYNNEVMIKCNQWYEVNGGLVSETYKDYPPSLDVKENSLTYILDAKGLLIIQQLFNGRGQVERALVYNYEFFY